MSNVFSSIFPGGGFLEPIHYCIGSEGMNSSYGYAGKARFVTHLFYADDVILFSKATSSNMNAILELFDF